TSSWGKRRAWRAAGLAPAPRRLALPHRTPGAGGADPEAGALHEPDEGGKRQRGDVDPVLRGPVGRHLDGGDLEALLEAGLARPAAEAHRGNLHLRPQGGDGEPRLGEALAP